MISSVQNMRVSAKSWASNFAMSIYGGNGPEGGGHWNIQWGAKFSDDDPFAPIEMPPSTWFILFSAVYLASSCILLLTDSILSS